MRWLLATLVAIGSANGLARAQGDEIIGSLKTRWAADVNPANVHDEYPRPQMVRTRWMNLNGLWDYAIRPKDEGPPQQYDGQILVPFPVESQLSGVQQSVGPDNRLWYRRTFSAPELYPDGRLLLHFGAVDWHATVWVNGQQVGEHKGGYTPFRCDITKALKETGEQELIVSVWDPTDGSFQPRGKQVREPRGIWYTAVTGIWQTVWLEPIPAAHIDSLKISPDVDGGHVTFQVQATVSEKPTALEIEIFEGNQPIAFERTFDLEKPLNIKIPNPRLWSPASPALYRVKVRLREGIEGGFEPDRTQILLQGVVDEVDSYVGMRKIEIRKDEDGFNRLFLNNEPIFQYGPLDQGWWPDGLYTAPADEALKYDLEVTQQLGFNMIRKHVKVEPARWYYHCDLMGLLVWQDMPSGDAYIRPEDPDITRSEESEANFRHEWREIIDSLHNHPCIVVWVPFNEGWGQFKTDEILAWTKEYDPTRLVDGPSGWADRGTGDMNDMHRYPGPGMPEPEEDRAVVLGEFGGLGLPLEEHLWWNKRNWGYRTYTSQEELQQNYEALIDQLRPLISQGLAAAVYTQTTDVEGEVNGLMTYDRAVVKFDVARLSSLHQKLYEPPPIVSREVIVPTSEAEGQSWRFTTTQPKGEWTAMDFDDSAWSEGKGGFGTEGTPGTVVRTEWNSEDIWMRRTVQVNEVNPANVKIRIHHDEDAEVYLNGQRIASVKGYVTQYIELPLGPTGEKLLKPGTNTLAVHCHQTGGGQYIDVGFVEVTEKPRPSGGAE